MVGQLQKYLLNKFFSIKVLFYNFIVFRHFLECPEEPRHYIHPFFVYKYCTLIISYHEMSSHSQVLILSNVCDNTR